MVLAILWLLVGVPTQAHRLKVKKDGAARDFLVGVITAACSKINDYAYVFASTQPLRRPSSEASCTIRCTRHTQKAPSIIGKGL